MLIQIKYPDNRFDYVKDSTLDRYIDDGKVSQFRRVSGWVTIGVDPVRHAKRQHTYRYPTEVRKVRNT